MLQQFPSASIGVQRDKNNNYYIKLLVYFCFGLVIDPVNPVRMKNK